MAGYLALVLHAHLPFVRHPEHERFLEESWLFEAITETYIPLLQLMDAWQRDGVNVCWTITLTPTLCSMLRDPLLQSRYERYLDELTELAHKECHRTHLDKPFYELADFYYRRFQGIRESWEAFGRDLVGTFGRHQETGRLEIITSAATHALLPLLVDHPPSLRAQVLVARDHYRRCFGRDPRGIWLPECAYEPGLDGVLQEANLRWFVMETHGVLHADPRPRYATFAPIFTRTGTAAFARDADSARQVWSREAGYPGDPRYRDFYRDIGFDLDLDYLGPHLPAPGTRGFTGLKYHRITGKTADKAVYDRQAALRAADLQAGHFLEARVAQFQQLAKNLDRPAIVVTPYDAELFGHWWYEGPEFVDRFARRACRDQKTFEFITPAEYLSRHPTQQVATPAASSWGEGGYWGIWLNEKNEWIYPHLRVAQERMTELVGKFSQPAPLEDRMLKQAGRELLLAQASDWPFILRAGTSPDYAHKRVNDHLLRFTRIYEMLTAAQLDADWLAQVEWRDNLFPDLEYRYWAVQ